MSRKKNLKKYAYFKVDFNLKLIKNVEIKV